MFLRMLSIFIGCVISIVSLPLAGHTSSISDCLAPVSEFSIKDVGLELEMQNLATAVRDVYYKHVIARYKANNAIIKQYRSFSTTRGKLKALLLSTAERFSLDRIGINFLYSAAVVVLIGVFVYMDNYRDHHFTGYTLRGVLTFFGLGFSVPLFKVLAASVFAVPFAFFSTSGKIGEIFIKGFGFIRTNLVLWVDLLISSFRIARKVAVVNSRVQSEITTPFIDKSTFIDTVVIKSYGLYAEKSYQQYLHSMSVINEFLMDVGEDVNVFDFISFINRLKIDVMINQEVTNSSLAHEMAFLKELENFMLSKSEGAGIGWNVFLEALEKEFSLQEKQLEVAFDVELEQVKVYDTKTVYEYSSDANDKDNDFSGRGIGGYDSNNAASLVDEMTADGSSARYDRVAKEVRGRVNPAKTAILKRRMIDNFKLDKKKRHDEYLFLVRQVEMIKSDTPFNDFALVSILLSYKIEINLPVAQRALSSIVPVSKGFEGFNGLFAVDFFKHYDEISKSLSLAA